jgi:nucleotide-binding universal stress UspA family protein
LSQQGAFVQEGTIEAIAHPTDFSEASAEAFAHSLRLALEYRCRLDLVHVRPQGGETRWSNFPKVRETLARWGLLPAEAAQPEVQQKLGIKVRKITLSRSDPLAGVADFLVSHRPDLVVMATHGAKGLNRWLAGSVSEGIAQRTRIPTLLVGPEARPFVNSQTGRMHLQTVVVPVARRPAPERALLLMHRLLGRFAVSRRIIHVGDRPYALEDERGALVKVELRRGPVVDTVISAANAYLADLLVMPTVGEQGFVDALRGSTTEQVVCRAPCPVLALPA